MKRPEISYQKVALISAKLTILLGCLTFVAWQSYHCLERFISAPQGTTLSIKHTGGQPAPELTVCPNDELYTYKLYSTDVLRDCGIFRVEAYKDEGKWVGLNGTNCTDPAKLHEALVPTVEDVIHSIGYIRYGHPDRIVIKPHTPTGKTHWEPLNWQSHGRCFTIHHRQDFIDQGIYEMRLRTLVDTEVYFHTPGWIQASKYRLMFELDINRKVYVDLEHEVHTSLDTEQDACVDTDGYSRDTCAHEELRDESLNTLGCISPFGPYQDLICRNVSKALNATELYRKYFIDHLDRCIRSCKYVSVRGVVVKSGFHGVLADGQRNGMMFISFREQIKTTQGYFVYSGLSLVAEIGGYVGLFLGVSVYHVTSLLEYFFKS